MVVSQPLELPHPHELPPHVEPCLAMHLKHSMTAARALSRMPHAPMRDWSDRAAEAIVEPGYFHTAVVCIALLDHEDAIVDIISTGVAVAKNHPTGTQEQSPQARRLELRCSMDAAKNSPWFPRPTPNPSPETVTAVRESLSPEHSARPQPWPSRPGSALVGGRTRIAPASKGWCVLVYALVEVAPQDRAANASLLLHVLSAALGELARDSFTTDDRAITWISPREQEVLELLLCGMTVREISGALHRSCHTIHDHVKSLHKKMGTKTRGGLVARVLGRTCHEPHDDTRDDPDHPFAVEPKGLPYNESISIGKSGR